MGMLNDADIEALIQRGKELMQREADLKMKLFETRLEMENVKAMFDLHEEAISQERTVAAWLN